MIAMKNLFLAAFIIGFMGVALFGFAMMDSHHNCVISGIFSSSCAQNALAMVASHFTAFGSFSSAIFSGLVIALLLILTSFALALDAKLDIFLKRILVFNPPSFFREKFLQWLEFHQKRDPFAFAMPIA